MSEKPFTSNAWLGQSRLQIAAVACVCWAILVARADSAEREPPVGQDAVVASVDDEPIYASRVDRSLEKILAGRRVHPAVLPLLQAQALSEIVDRRLVVAYARRTTSGATESEIEAALAQMKSRLASQGRSPGDSPQQQPAEAELRRQVVWNLTWSKYLARYLTQTRLESYYRTHRRDFDGTEISVSHILLRPDADAGRSAAADLIGQARTIRRAIASGDVSFADAARRHSAGPSGTEGGELGFIGRHGPMVEGFSRAAFELEAGQVGQPVTTPFGVHLIRCNEIRPGDKPLADVRELVEEALARELIGKLARLQRRYCEVEYTGKAPYFKPGTRELVVP